MTLEDWQDWGKRRDALAKLDKSVLVLLVVDWAYSVLPIFEGQFPKDKRPRLALEAAEKYISSAVDAVAVNAAASAARAAHWAAASVANPSTNVATNVAWAVADAARAAASAADAADTAVNAATVAYASYVAHAAWAAAYAAHASAAADTVMERKWQWLLDTYLAALGPTNKTFNEEWLTPTVKSLVQTNDILLLPIIADSLEDAGCDNNDILQHLRSNPAFTRADWVWRQLKG